MKIRNILNYGNQIIEIVENFQYEDLKYNSEGGTFGVGEQNTKETLSELIKIIRLYMHDTLIYDRIILSEDESKNV